MIGHNSAWGSTVALPAEHSLRKQSTNPYSSSGILPQTSATTKSGKACIHFPFNIHFPPPTFRIFQGTILSHIFLSSVSWSDLGVRQRSFLPPHHASSGTEGQPASWTSLSAGAWGRVERNVQQICYTAGGDTWWVWEQAKSHFSPFFFLAFHCTTGLIVQTIQPFPKTQQVRAVSWWVRRSLQLRPVPKSSVLTSNRSTDTTEVKDSNSHCLL